MNNPEEKAKELVDRFLLNYYHYENAVQCAFIATDEIIKQWEYIDTYLGDGNGELNPNLRYWMKVRKELEK